MDVFERIKQQVESTPVLLYMKGTPSFPQCGFSGRAVQILQACGGDFGYVNIFEDPELRESLKEFSHWPTFPQLYIDGQFVGGCDIMMELFEKGDLEKMVKQAGTVERSDEAVQSR